MVERGLGEPVQVIVAVRRWRAGGGESRSGLR